MRRWLSKNTQLIAFIIVAVATTWGFKAAADSNTDKLYNTQIEICNRNDQLRVESNNRLKAHIIERNTLASFLATARKARLHTYKITHDLSDKHTSYEYLKFIQKLNDKVTFDKLPIIDCKKAIPKP